jgi:hypothetical protein
MMGIAGVALTTTLVDPAAEVHPATVIVTEYVPLAAVVAEGIVGFCEDEAKPFGPVHEYVAPETAAVDRDTVPPAQYGPVFEAVGVAGAALTTTFVVPADEVHPATVIVTEYVPLAAVVAEGIVGFCEDEAKPFGPVHEYVAPETAAVDRDTVPPAQYGPVFEAVGVAGGVQPEVMVRMPLPMADWPSGFVIVTFFAPAVALVVSRLSVTSVGLFHVTLLTMTPETAEASRVRQGSPERLAGVS